MGKFFDQLGRLIVDAVNRETGQNIAFVRLQGNAVFATDGKGGRYVIPFLGHMDNGWHVRGLIAPSRRGKIAWLGNGQCTKGRQLHWWAEGEVTVRPTREMVHQYWLDTYGPDWGAKREKLHGEGKAFIMAYPSYLL